MITRNERRRTVVLMAKTAFAVLLILWLVNPAGAQESPEYWPTEGWRSSSPEEQGIDSAVLAAAINILYEQDSSNIHSLLVIRNGYVVTDAYFYPYAPGEPHDLASVTKSVMATLVGIAIHQGYLQGVDQPVGDIVPMPADKAAITLEDLLTMRSGITCIDSVIALTLLQMMQTADWFQYVQELPLETEAGTRWYYCSPAVHLLGGIVQAAVGQSTFDFAMQNLFEPLGIQEVGWPRDPQGLVHGWGDLRLTPYDMAKIGYLYLNNGHWEGEQLLPENWVNDTTTNIRATGEQGYGYLWWLADGYYAAEGRGGQYILVVPNEALIVVITGSGEIDPGMILNGLILPAIKSDGPLAANPAGEAALQDGLDTAALAPEFEAQPVGLLPPLAEAVSGKTIRLDPNLFGLITVSLSFSPTNEAVLHLTTDGLLAGDDDFSWTAGLDGVPRRAPGRFDLAANGTGQWTANDVFTMRIDEIGNNNLWELQLTFDAGKVTITMTSEAGGAIVTGTIEE